MPHKKRAASLLILFMATSARLFSQAPANSSKLEPDVLLFTDGEKLIGHLESATGSSVVFKSDMAGEVTVDWKKIQELRSSQKFAVIPKDVKLRKREDANRVPQGAVAMTDQKLQVNTSAGTPPKTIPVGNIGNLVEEGDFQKALHPTSFLQDWKGAATAGISLTEATQKNQTFTAAVNLMRAVPSESWLDVHTRTTFDYNQAYGKLTQPGSPAVKTSLYHVDGEEDWYLSPKLFLFGQAAFDHSFSQGLTLQQTYEGGLGVVLIKTSKQELDVKASADYIDQRFATPGRDQQLFGTTFGETYTRK